MTTTPTTLPTGATEVNTPVIHRPDDNRLLTVKQAAGRLRISTRSVWRLLRQGAFPVVYVGARCTRFNPADIAAYLASRTIRHAPLAD